jgi:hypothetical protein
MVAGLGFEREATADITLIQWHLRLRKFQNETLTSRG